MLWGAVHLDRLVDYVWAFLVDPPGWLTALGTVLAVLGAASSGLKVVRTGPRFWAGCALMIVAGLVISQRSPLWLLHPTGTFDTLPEHDSADDLLQDIAGSVRGVLDPASLKAVVYARTDHWYVQPFAAQPFTDIDADGAWQTQTHPGTEYAALIVRPSHQPASVLDALPATNSDVLLIVRQKRGTPSPGG